MEAPEALHERVRREQQLMDRLRTAAVHFTDAQIERAWAISSAHQSGLSIRRIAAATHLSSSRVHQVLNSAEAEDMPAWLSRLREADSSPEMCGRLVEEAKILRRCIDWLRRMERGESVVVNLRLDTDTETEYVPLDRALPCSPIVRQSVSHTSRVPLVMYIESEESNVLHGVLQQSNETCNST